MHKDTGAPGTPAETPVTQETMTLAEDKSGLMLLIYTPYILVLLRKTGVPGVYKWHDGAS